MAFSSRKALTRLLIALTKPQGTGNDSNMNTNHSNSLRSRIRRVTEIQSNPGLSISRQTAKKLHILYRYGRGRWAAKGYLGDALSGIRDEAHSRNGREAIIIANGHSTNQLDAARVSEAMNNGLDVFSMNSFLLSDLSWRITPSHYVLSDGFHRSDTESDTSKRLWEILDANPQIQLLAHTLGTNLEDRRPSTCTSTMRS